MRYVKVELTNDPAHDNPKDWFEAEIPIFYPHEILRYLFEELGVAVPSAALSKYWSEAKEAGLPRIPLKLFADDAQFNDEGDKDFARKAPRPRMECKQQRKALARVAFPRSWLTRAKIFGSEPQTLPRSLPSKPTRC